MLFRSTTGTEPKSSGSESQGNANRIRDERIPDYVETRSRQIEWMNSVASPGDSEKCASAIMDIIVGRKSWPELNLLVLGADAEMHIRDKCHAVLRNLDEWKDVVRGVAMNS